MYHVLVFRNISQTNRLFIAIQPLGAGSIELIHCRGLYVETILEHC